MKFSQLLWTHTLPIYQKILAHPFNQELASGALCKNKFHFYLEQDTLYLQDFSRALAFIAARSHSSSTIHQFIHFALGALIDERAIHSHFLGGYSNDDTIPTPSCLAYTRYLIAAAATAPLEEAIAAVLPCFWIYREIGKAISLQNHAEHPYRHWINTYASGAFSDETDLAIALCDEMASHCTSRQRERMQIVFEECAQWEWHFWNDAYEMTIFRSAKTDPHDMLTVLDTMGVQ